MLFMIMKSDINILVCILFVHLSSISLKNFRDRALIISEILQLIKLDTYKVGLVYIWLQFVCISPNCFRGIRGVLKKYADRFHRILIWKTVKSMQRSGSEAIRFQIQSL